MPELTIPTSLTTNEMQRLLRLAEGMDVVELGAQFGASTVVMAASARSVHSVDWHQGDDHAGYRDTLHDYFYNVASCRNVISHIGRFENVLPSLRRNWFDLAFIDGQHDAVSVMNDFKLTNPLMKSTGVIAFHDYGRFGVAETVDLLFGKPDELVDTLAIVRLDGKWPLLT